MTEIKKGTEVWWFRLTKLNGTKNVDVDSLELVHDMVTDVNDNFLICWHSTVPKHQVWGTSKEEAWNRLKKNVAKWSPLDE